MIVKVYIPHDPHRFNLEDMRRGCPRLFAALNDESVSVTAVTWDGTIELLPKEEQVIVLVTARLIKQHNCTYTELASYCFRYQHLMIIFDEGVLGPGGDIFLADEDPFEFNMTIRQFLDCLPKH